VHHVTLDHLNAFETQGDQLTACKARRYYRRVGSAGAWPNELSTYHVTLTGKLRGVVSGHDTIIEKALGSPQ